MKRQIYVGIEKILTFESIFTGNVAVDLKIKFMAMWVYPTILYAAPTWTLSKKAESMLNPTQMSLIRSMLGNKLLERMSNVHILKRVKMKNIKEAANHLRNGNGQDTWLHSRTMGGQWCALSGPQNLIRNK